MIDASQENARMLASLLGVDEAEAAGRLDQTILVTVAEDLRSGTWADEITAMLERTVKVTTDPEGHSGVELVVGPAHARSDGPAIHADIDRERAVIAAAPVSVSESHPHPLFGAIAACPVVAAVLKLAIDAAGLPDVKLPLSIRMSQLGIPAERLGAPVDLSDSVLIGAGAVGHAFVRALRHVDARGVLPIVDPKTVGGGNPNRCLYLTNDDVGRNKAEALAHHAQADFPNLELTPFVEDFGSFSKREGAQRTVFVTVDSRRVRRSIQGEVPGRVLDASTTDIRAVVVHSHVQPTTDACLSCIYRHVPDEHVRERAIADGLGIDIETVKESLVSEEAAVRIAALHPGLDAKEIRGKAFDSLFKALCAEKALRTPEGRQVLAPFAFVSCLAGALLVVELLRSDAGTANTNYWQVDPWGAPVARIRSLRARAVDCEFCSRPIFLAVANDLWGAAAVST